eukprot:TRINITY_DN10656_c0_g1_i1.p2 TRINITY_DN10656_c0_g1~~TRINITY_DN10656_c0_g1_i1.p2  ORF type:complete len:332 (+),score=150.98 TRINITY_DN10656_c0_g1_i1:81-998(+)
MPQSEAQLREAFDLFDANRSNSIDAQELLYALQGLGHEHVTEEDVADFMRQIDRDHNGQISFEEFKQLVQEQEKSAGGPQEVLKAFQVFDLSGAGEISKQDLRGVATSIGFSTDQVTADDINEIHKYCAEMDPSGRFTFYAWRQIMADMHARQVVRSSESKAVKAAMHLPSTQEAIWEELSAKEDREREERARKERQRIEQLEWQRQRAAEAKQHLTRAREEAAEIEARKERARQEQWADAERQKEETRAKLRNRRQAIQRQQQEEAERKRLAAEEHARTEERIRQKAAKAEQHADPQANGTGAR